MIHKLTPFVFLACWLGLCSPSSAWEKSLTKAPAGPYKAKKKCKLNYQLTWDGKLNSGEYTIEFDRNTGKSKTVSVKSYGKSSGFVRRIFPYDFNAVSKYNGSTLKPISYHIWEKTKDETKTLDGHFKKDFVTLKEVSTDQGETTPETKKRLYRYPNMFDLFSSTLYIGSQPLNNGDHINLVVYPFNKPYLIRVKVLGRETHLGHPCVKLDLKMNKIRDDKSLKNYDKMKTTTMWITDNPDRIMVELRSKIFIGDVRATLKSSEWN